MGISVGIALSTDSVRLVAVRSGAIVTALEVELADRVVGTDLIEEVVVKARLPRFPRPRVVVALGPSLAQTRRVGGLPPLVDPRIVSRLVREGSSRFFLHRGGPLLTTGVRIVEPGTVWAAALDESTVRSAEAMCARAGLKLVAFVPSVSVLGRGLEDAHVLWRDGSVAAELEHDDGILTRARLLGAPASSETQPPCPVPTLAQMGERGWRFADAYGAAVAGFSEPVSLRPGRSARAVPIPAWRRAAAVAGLVLSVAVALVLPGFRAIHLESRAAAGLTAMQAERRAVAQEGGQLQSASAALSEIALFAARRRSPSLLLADLTRALPARSALVTLRVDSSGGSLVALAPRAETVLTALEKVPGLGGTEVVGPVTREVVLGREVERVSVRFRLTPYDSSEQTLREGR